MNTRSRIVSILKADNLDTSVTGLPSFNLSALDVPTNLEFPLPTNVRLGHLAEKVISQLIKLSTNYQVLYENVQVMEEGKTIGEIDFIIEEIDTKKQTHLELAYKFYLFDPSISSKAINNWIGPNRNDSLIEKLEKLKTKQFPLLYHDGTRSTLSDIDIDDVSQALCLLVSLFVPYEYKLNFSPAYTNAIEGYYINFDTFINLDHSQKTYYLPTKKEWGMDPSENEIWEGFSAVERGITNSLQEKQALLCWQKHGEEYSTLFIVWW